MKSDAQRAKEYKERHGIVRKVVEFKASERRIMEWADKVGMPFAQYVKKLIKKDMEERGKKGE